MLNFAQIITRAAGNSADTPIVAAPYPLSDSLCRRLINEGIISGYIAEHNPGTGSVHPFIRGWWVNRRGGAWYIRSCASHTLLLLSGNADHEISGGMVLEAGLKGIRRILLVAEDGSITQNVNVRAVILERMQAPPVRNPLYRMSYEDMFEDMYALIGDRLRLPSSAFGSERILLMTGSLDAGGAERQVAYTAVGLAKRFPGQIYLGRVYPERDFFGAMVAGAGVILNAIPEEADEYNEADILEIRNELASRYSALGVLSIFYMIFNHALLIRDVRPGLVHAWQEFSNILGGIAADWVGVPRLILGGRSVAPDNFEIFQPYMAPGYQALFKRRECVFLNNSEAGARDYVRWLGLPRDRFRVVKNGFEFPEISTETRISKRRELGICDNSVVVGSIIRFGEEKRPELLMETALELHRSHPHSRFVVFGTGPLLGRCQDFIAKNGLEDFVKLPGLTPDAWGSLSALDVFLLTSRVEGLPNVMIEAQGMGLPVVCTDTGGMSEAFVEGITGFAVSSENAADLAQKIASLIDDPALRTRMGQNARHHARDQFGIERMIEATIAAYEGAIEHKSDFGYAPDWREELVSPGITVNGAIKEHGFCFVAQIACPQDCSGLELWEDDRLLGPGYVSRDYIRHSGAGHWRVENEHIFFSSSDGSDVRFNGRTYRLRSRYADDEFEDIRVTGESVNPDNGFCYLAPLDLGQESARFGLWEDDRRLGPGGCLHEEIRVQGQGRYSVWNGVLYFSSSDNTDPRTNGRTYVLRRSKTTDTVLRQSNTAGTRAECGGNFGGSLDEAMSRLLRSGVPRNDFVPSRIVHVCGNLGPGGAERQILYTLAGLANKSCESVQLLCYYLGSTMARHDFYLPAFKAAGVPVRPIRRHTAIGDIANMPLPLREVAHILPAGLAEDIADLYWEFSELRPEVVHSWLDWNNERAGIAAALAGVPRIVLSGRNMNPTHFVFHEPYMRSAYQTLLRLPHVTMLNNSKAGAVDYASWLGMEPKLIRSIYNGIDFGSRCRPLQGDIAAARKKLSLDPAAFVVGGVFRFAAEKRPLLWVDTAAQVALRVPNARFILFGEGEMAGEMQKSILALGLEDRVLFGGVISDILEAISMMDILLLTSEVEGLPNVVLEAQWVGTPVVATAAGGTSEALEIGRTGWIVDSADPVKLAEAIHRLFQNPEERSAVQRLGPALVKRRFGVMRMVEETLDVYRLAKPNA
jgi:glycosyltransferase involved in cell wall biosynthesis